MQNQQPKLRSDNGRWWLGILTSPVCNIESRMLPIAVLAPTPTTIALALPETTTVPWQWTCPKSHDTIQAAENMGATIVEEHMSKWWAILAGRQSQQISRFFWISLFTVSKSKINAKRRNTFVQTKKNGGSALSEWTLADWMSMSLFYSPLICLHLDLFLYVTELRAASSLARKSLLMLVRLPQANNTISEPMSLNGWQEEII